MEQEWKEELFGCIYSVVYSESCGKQNEENHDVRNLIKIHYLLCQ